MTVDYQLMPRDQHIRPGLPTHCKLMVIRDAIRVSCKYLVDQTCIVQSVHKDFAAAGDADKNTADLVTNSDPHRSKTEEQC
jgi:hypothetical protein